jgi:hypothetical protein
LLSTGGRICVNIGVNIWPVGGQGVGEGVIPVIAIGRTACITPTLTSRDGTLHISMGFSVD